MKAFTEVPMKVSPCYLFCRSLEFCSAAEIELVPPATKGIFVLYETGDLADRVKEFAARFAPVAP